MTTSEWEGTAWAGEVVELQTRQMTFPPLEAQMAAITASRTQLWQLPSIRQALSVPAISRCVTLISNATGSLAIEGWQDGVLMPNTPRLLVRPDPFQTPREAYRDMAYCLATRGEAVLWIAARDADDLAASLVVVPPAELQIEQNPRNRLYPIYTWGTVKSTRYSPANRSGQFVHITYLKEPGALRGMGPLQLNGAATSVSVEALQWAANFFAEGGYPSIIIKKAGALAPGEEGVSEADILRNQWISRPANTPRIIDEGIESVTEHTPNQQGAQMLDAREHQNGDAARMFGVPGDLLEYNSPGSSLTYQNVSEVFTSFVRGCLSINYLEPIEQGLSDCLPRQIVGRFNVAGFTRADVKTRFDVYESAISRSGVMTVEEARAAEGLAPGNIEYAPQQPSPPTAIPSSLPDNDYGMTVFEARDDTEYRCTGTKLMRMNGVTKVGDCRKLLARGKHAPVGMACPRCKKVYEAAAEVPGPRRLMQLQLRQEQLVEVVEPDPVVGAMAEILRRLERMEQQAGQPVPVQYTTAPQSVLAEGSIVIHNHPPEVVVSAGLPLEERVADEDEDHFYGAWIGGKASAGGHPATTRGPAPGSLAATQAHVASRFGYADFTGIRAEDAALMADSVAELDKLADQFPNVVRGREALMSSEGATPWAFAGIGTTASLEAPGNVKALMGDAWGATKGLSQHNGARIWINVTDPKAFAEGTGVLGDIGFTFERTTQDAMVHEFGHVVHVVSRHALEDVNSAVWSVYGDMSKPSRAIMRDLGIYAGQSPEERYATIFAVLHAPGGMARLKLDAARARVRRVQREANRYRPDDPIL